MLCPTCASCGYRCFFFVRHPRKSAALQLAASYVFPTKRTKNRRWFVSESEDENSTLLALMKRLDPRNTGVIDYVGWSNQMRLDNLAEIAA